MEVITRASTSTQKTLVCLTKVFFLSLARLTILNTATTDGLMVQYQWAIVVEYLLISFIIDSEGMRRRAT